jgi:hypothetical protein
LARKRFLNAVAAISQNAMLSQFARYQYVHFQEQSVSLSALIDVIVHGVGDAIRQVSRHVSNICIPQ